ncbi:hypothetical protein P9578_17920 [Brevibacillus choshinensis]|nr:hypothetical protein [Brevibacillus choshinensis]MED4782262.1 hypothetical protein [Brevibacillus choshinensis]
MKKEDILFSIQKEMQDRPEVTSLEISQRYKIPFVIVEIFRLKLKK